MCEEIKSCVICDNILSEDEKEVFGNTCYSCMIEGNEEDIEG